MKIIIVGQYYWPDNFLVNDIAEELVKRGNKVTVLTGLPDYATNHVPTEYKWFRKRHEVRNGVEIIRVPIIARHKGFIFRILNYISFFTTSSIYAKFARLDADIIMAYQTAPVLMGNAGIVLKKKLKKPLFYYCVDIWPDQIKAWNINESHFLFKWMLKYSTYAYGSGDVVGITSKPFRKYLVEMDGVNDEKIVYLPQHSDEMMLGEVQPFNSNNTNFIFAGNIGKQQNLECIIEAASLIEADINFTVHIYGDGTSLEDCRRLAKELNVVDRVVFYGRVPKEKLSSVYASMDAFLLTLCSEKQIGYVANTVPAKFQNYMSAGKPIIASIDGGARDIIEETQCGIAVPASDAKGLSDAMKDYILHKERYSECGENAIKYFNENYTKEIFMDRLLGIFNMMIKK